MDIDIDQIIKVAKLGCARKDAQVDTCTVFAAALYDVLWEQGIPCRMSTAVNRQGRAWAHEVVEVAGHFYDSLGEFSTAIYRAHAKIHPKVSLTIQYQKDVRVDCYDSEFDELYIFYVKELKKAIRRQVAEMTA